MLRYNKSNLLPPIRLCRVASSSVWLYSVLTIRPGERLDSPWLVIIYPVVSQSIQLTNSE